jgi:hypothetical protein
MVTQVIHHFRLFSARNVSGQQQGYAGGQRVSTE